MLALAAQTAWSQAASRLEKVELHPQPGEQVEVRLVLDGPAPAPVTFTIDNPARLAVDLPGTALALESRRIDVKSGGVDTIVAAEASGRTRLVFNLDRMQPYNVRTDGNTVVRRPSAAARRPRPRRRRPRPPHRRPRLRPEVRPRSRRSISAGRRTAAAGSSCR